MTHASQTVPTGASDGTHRGMPFGALGPFLAIAFGLVWGIGTLFVLFQEQLEGIFGELGYTNPLFILIVYAPGIAGLFLVWRHYGIAGLGAFLRRLTLWRMPVLWWVVLLLGIPAVKYLGAALAGTLDDPFAFSPWYGVLPALAA